MDTFASLVERLGGAAKLAKFTGELPGTVQQRKARNNFPPETWPELIRWARKQGASEVDEPFLVKVAIASKEENDRQRAAERSEVTQQSAA